MTRMKTDLLSAKEGAFQTALLVGTPRCGVRVGRKGGLEAPLLGYLAIQTFFGSVKKRRASSPPSRPTPLCFMPPKGTRRSRTSQQFIHTVPVWMRSATRWARLRFWVHTLEARPYSLSFA